MGKADLVLDKVFSFLLGGDIVQEENDVTDSPVDITGWLIKGTIIVDADDESQDIAITGTITDAINGAYEITVSDIDKDFLFANFADRQGMCYELKAHFPDNTGAELSSGTIVFDHSRELSDNL